MQYPTSFGAFKDKLYGFVNDIISKIPPSFSTCMVTDNIVEYNKTPDKSQPIGSSKAGIPKLTIQIGGRNVEVNSTPDNSIQGQIVQSNASAQDFNQRRQAGSRPARTISQETPQTQDTIAMQEYNTGSNRAPGSRIVRPFTDLSPYEGNTMVVVTPNTNTSIQPNENDGTLNYASYYKQVSVMSNVGQLYTTLAVLSKHDSTSTSNKSTVMTSGSHAKMLYQGPTPNAYTGSDHKNMPGTSSKNNNSYTYKKLSETTKGKTITETFQVPPTTQRGQGNPSDMTTKTIDIVQWPLPSNVLSTTTITPKAIVMHWTGGDSAQAAWDEYANINNHIYPEYVIGETGTIFQLAPDNIRGHHTDIADGVAIGIEMAANGPGALMGNQAILDSSLSLVQYLQATYSIPKYMIWAHYEVGLDLKNAPGYAEYNLAQYLVGTPYTDQERADHPDPGNEYMQWLRGYL